MRRQRASALAVTVVLVLVGVLVLACTSPTLPLPPPALPTVSLGPTSGTFELRSDKGALPNALIVAVSRNESLARDQRVAATLADSLGSWDLLMKGNAGDFVDVSQEDGSNRSQSTTVQLR